MLNIGNSVTEALPFGVRFMDGILNAAACRNAGYQPIPVTELMPAVQCVSPTVSDARTNNTNLMIEFSQSS